MIILGIDPGTATTGWGIVRSIKNGFDYVEAGVISTPANLALEKRLLIIHKDIKTIVKQYQPDVCALELLFFNTNAKTAMIVGQARGAVMLTSELLRIPLFSYTPLQVKIAITGYGRADKQQMQKMVQKLLKLKAVPQPDDAADALAVALTHGFSAR